jgi:hypothetical protein
MPARTVVISASQRKRFIALGWGFFTCAVCDEEHIYRSGSADPAFRAACNNDGKRVCESCLDSQTPQPEAPHASAHA